MKTATRAQAAMTPELAVKRAQEMAAPRAETGLRENGLAASLRGKKDVGYYSKKAARDQIDLSSYTFFLRGSLPIKAACRAATTASHESFLDAYALAVQFKQGYARGEPRWRRHTYRLSQRWPEPPSAV
jgi:hypothetical protein